MNHNKIFEQKIRDNVVAPFQRTQVQSGYGIVWTYNARNNTATILMSAPDSDAPQEFFHDVPCPVQLGVQGAAPEEGRMCQVVFKNGNPQWPVITNFYNYHYRDADYNKQTRARQPIPRYLLTM